MNTRFSEQAHRTLTQLAAATHVTTSGVVRDALSVYWWLAREYGQGGRFLVQRGSDVTESTLPSLEGMDALPEGESGPPPRRGPTEQPPDEPTNGRPEHPGGSHR